MFKVYAVYSNNDKFFTDTFFVKIDKAIVWVKSDIEIDEKPYFSDQQIKKFLEKSNVAQQYEGLMKGQAISVQYGVCTNHYLVIKMTQEEITLVKTIANEKLEMKHLQTLDDKKLLRCTRVLKNIEKTIGKPIVEISS